jgi:hypothetical protein
MPLYSVELSEHRTYSKQIWRVTREEAEQELRMLAANREIEPATIDVTCDAFPVLYCEGCQQKHFGPACPERKPAVREGEFWERRSAHHR